MTVDTVVVIAVVLGAVGYLAWRVVAARRKQREGCDNCGH